MIRIKYIYVTSREYTSAVYQTQVIDWLNLFREKGLDFDLWHVFYRAIHASSNLAQYRASQIKQIRAAYQGETKEIYLMPVKLVRLNQFVFYRLIRRYYKDYDKIVIFSRDDIGSEIEYLKKKMGERIVYYFDLRGAMAEERLLSLRNKKEFSLEKFRKIADVAYSEYHRQELANKIFAVSNALQRYYISNYDTDKSKFVLYPCLSSSSKFYYDTTVRCDMRKLLGFAETDDVYIYSGGLTNSWHIPDSFLTLFSEIARKDANAWLLVISPKLTEAIKRIIESSEILKKRVVLKEAIPNHEVFKYLNASDFGILLRENNPVNNVAFPSKYAEYMLCGLPTIVSEAIYDCADFCKNYNCGYVMPNSLLSHMEDFSPLRKDAFDRNAIAAAGKQFLSKEASIDRIVNELKIEG